MADQNYSGDTLISFLKFASTKGLIKAETARSRRTAVKRLLSVADEGELNDVREIDVDTLFSRFQNINSREFKPESLGVYKSRFSSALTDFLNWKENPSAFKPSTKTRATKGVRSLMKSKSKDDTDKPSTPYSNLPNYMSESSRDLLPPSITPVSLRDVAVLIRIENIPADITTDEANKLRRIMDSIANTIGASAMDT